MFSVYFWFQLLSLASFFLTAFWQINDEIKLESPNPTYLFEDKSGLFLSESNEQEVGFWSVDDPIPKKIEHALLAIEDHRFYDHYWG